MGALQVGLKRSVPQDERGEEVATTSCLCESPAFLSPAVARDSLELRPQVLSKLCQITPSLVLQGKGSARAMCTRAIAIQYTSTNLLLAKRILSRHSSLPRSQHSAHHVFCPCPSPADHTDAHHPQTAPPASAAPSLKGSTIQGRARTEPATGDLA